jgi:uncharacterized membrane protein
MGKDIRWLYAESERWVRDGILTAEQATRLRALYPAPQPTRPWATLIFCGLGAVIVGLGVILLFAYNWHAMPKFAKLATVFIALAAAHAGGLYLFLARPRYRALGEALTVAGTMLFGAGIWLVAQVYHISEHFPTAFLLWGMGAFLLAWAMPSIFQALMALALLTIWAGTESAAFEVPVHAALPLLLIGLLPLAYRQRSRVLLVCLLVAVGVSLAFISAACSQGPLPMLVLLAFSVLAMGAGWLHEEAPVFPESALCYRGLGMAAYLVLIYILSFGDAAHEILDLKRGIESWSGAAYWVVPLAAALAAWVLLAVRRLRAGAGITAPAGPPADLWLAPLALLAAYALAAFLPRPDKWLAALPFNLVLLAHAVSLMAQGVRRSEMRAVAIGCILLVALTGARYADLFESLLARGMAFLVVGGALFVEGFLYARGKRGKGGA